MTADELAAFWRVPIGTMRGWKTKGADPKDPRQVFTLLRKTTRKPDMWREVFETDDEDSHEFWKKEKDKEAAISLRLKNEKARGEVFERDDGEAVQSAWGSALVLAITERRGTEPQLLAGKDEAWIAEYMEEKDRRMLAELSDLESGLWQQVYEKYATGETSSDEEKGGAYPPQGKADGKRVVRRKRQSGSGANT